MTPLLIAENDSTPPGFGVHWPIVFPARYPAPIRDCRAPRQWVSTETVEQTRIPIPAHAHEDGGGCPVVNEDDALYTVQTTGHSRPRRIPSSPAMHEESNNMHRSKRRGGEPVPGNIRDCRAMRGRQTRCHPTRNTL